MKTRLLICFLFFSSFCNAQTNNKTFTETLQSFFKSPAEAQKQWQYLKQQEQVPFAVGDSVAFLYEGTATSVAWMGDFNGWGYDKKFLNKGTRIPQTDLWLLKASFPADARLDYKIVVNETNWILDPQNPHQQWSGVGGGSPNSELRMPGWKEDPVTKPTENIPHGRVQKDILLSSVQLGYQVMYSLYNPPGYTSARDKDYPVLYVLDGYEYLHDQLGNIPVILDNLIHLKKIKPVRVVFVDHREPVNRANNRRMQELAMNAQYLKFMTQELIPKVEGAESKRDAKDRAILGTSMGGLSAAYFAFSNPDVFGLAGVQSPAFWFKPEIYTLCDNPQKPPVKTFMTTGTVNDTREGALKMKSILEKNTCTYQYTETHQGHSWGNWRDQTDDILIYFFGVE